MRRCLLEDRAHLAVLQTRSFTSVRPKPVATGVNLRLEDFSPLLDTNGGEAALLAARRLANYLIEAQDESSLGIIGIEPELLALVLERLEQCVMQHARPELECPIDVCPGESTYQILSAILSIFTLICANSHAMVLAGIASADDTTEKSLAQRLTDDDSLVRRLLRAARALVEHPSLRHYEPVTMALRLVGNLTSHGLCVVHYLLESGLADSICTLMNTSLYTCFTSIRAEVQWVFTAMASHFPSDQGGDSLVTRLDKCALAASPSKTYLEVALHSSMSCIASSLQTMNTQSDNKLYDRWYLSICWFMYSFMCPCLVGRNTISNASILELIIRSISVLSLDISNVAVAALNQYSMNVPKDIKKETIFTGHAVALLRHSFASLFAAYIDASMCRQTDSYQVATLKEALIFLNNENSESEIPGFWVQTIASLYAKLLRIHKVPSANNMEVLELLTEALGSTVSICSIETMRLLCSSNVRIFSQLIKILKSYKSCVQIRQMVWKSGSILLIVSELLRTMINYVPEEDLKLYKHDLTETISALLEDDIDVQTAEILEELGQYLTQEDD